MYAMRNGIVADTLRKGGSPFRMIFGVNLPQLSEIAAEHGHDSTLAHELWNDRACRESMLLATMLLDVNDVNIGSALEMLDQSPTIEVTDVLCHSLLRKMPDAMTVASAALNPQLSDMTRYGGVRLAWNLIPTITNELRKQIELEMSKKCPMTERVSMALIEELNFLVEHGSFI